MSPSLPTAFSPESFTLHYVPEQHILVGRWLRPVELAELQVHYEALLEAALAHGCCHHWLLDVRRRRLTDAAAVQWFGEVFSPRLAVALGQPVSLAYFAMVTQTVASEDPGLWQNIQTGALHGGHYQYFNYESEALAWLAQRP